MNKKEIKYDFAGWATKNDILCSDGRTIRKNAFKDNDGQTVPLVYNHDHKNIDSVIGHALLENRDNGVYAYCTLNTTPSGIKAKEMIKNGDVRSLSIYANQLRQNGSDVVHGYIREVSLVLAGANPGAFINTVIEHSDDQEEEAVIYHAYDENTDGDSFEMYHEEESKPDSGSNDDNKEKSAEKTVEEVLNTFNDEQLNVLYFLVGKAVEEGQNVKHNDSEEGKENNIDMEEQNMKLNIFDTGMNTENRALAHSALEEILTSAKRSGSGSIKDAYKSYVEAHTAENDKPIIHALDEALAHSITNIGELFPDAKAVGPIQTLDRDQEWVGKVMAGTKHTPFSRVKSSYMDITGEQARAKGYVKGTQKVEEVVAAFKRKTTPTTVYKLQKLDRDDVIDITDWDVVAWIKNEMRGKLDEEIARAVLIGDGRAVDDPYKIDPQNIRPILGDNSVYTIAKTAEKAAGDDEYTFAKKVIRQMVKARKEYKGSGTPTLYCSQDFLTDCLLIEDTNGRCIYDDINKLKTKLMVKDIVPIELFNTQVREADSYNYKLMAILVNLSDYNIGADKGGQVTMFDDFDINFNKYEYLIETRCSGALVVPKSAITFEEKYAAEATSNEEASDGE